jgi:hypothetical protein
MKKLTPEPELTVEDRRQMHEAYLERAKDPKVAALYGALRSLKYLCNPAALADYKPPEG